jgi:hypothetical protein
LVEKQIGQSRAVEPILQGALPTLSFVDAFELKAIWEGSASTPAALSKIHSYGAGPDRAGKPP